MYEKRFLKGFCFIVISGLCLLLSFSVPVSAYYGAGIPLTQQLTSVQNTPFNTSTLNAFSYRDLTTLYNTQASTLANPFANYAQSSASYADIFSQAGAQQTSYSNIFGVNFQQGQGFYRDPFYTTGGSYTDYSSPFGGVSFDQGFSATPYGSASQNISSLTTPWTHYGTSISNVSGMGVVGTIAGAMPSSFSQTNIQHTAFGMPTGFNMLGLNPDAAGQLAVHAYGLETAAMDRILSDNYMYTEQGMPFIGTASYYNPDSYGGSNWFFPSGGSNITTGTENVGGMTNSYVIGQETTGGYFPGYGGFVSGATGAGTSSYTGSIYTGGFGGGWASGGFTGAGITGIGGGFSSAGGNTYGGGGFTYTGTP